MARRPAPLQAWLAASLWVFAARGDVYLHNPRGSNNKLSEQNNNVANNQRLFDSQNNEQGGYQIGDNCQPVCQDANRNYDESQPGAMKGQLTYYAGSELYIEWALQHSCGFGGTNTICQVILQYMCDSDNPGLRDGVQRGNENTAGGEQEIPTAEEADAKNGNGDYLLGQQEPLQFYLDCRARERNKGIYTADQQMNDNRGATATRQNPNGNGPNQRNGLECPEERDYYPYWHPTPWHDIAVITDEPDRRCDYYQAESQNVRAKNYCSDPQHNNEAACVAGGASWQEQPAFDEPPPRCVAGVRQRDNHNGNSEGAHPQYFIWKIPEGLEGRCALRLRYNISTGDFRPGSTASGGGAADEGRRLGRLARAAAARRLTEASGSAFPPRDIGGDYFFVDAAQNDPDPGRRRRSIFTGGPPVLPQDPVSDFVNLGPDYLLQMNLNTNQLSRTFQDRTHSFYVSARPSDVPEGARIVNYNVRGRRGNIVQVYPAVEYDFVPNDLTVEEGDFLHFQWTGSDANNKGNDGNGRQGTDRSNLVQMDTRDQNIPMAKEGHTLFYDAAEDPDNEEGLANLRKMAYLNQNYIVTCDQNPNANEDNSVTDCQQLNGASAYFDGGVIEMKQVGEHKVMSTRNNDFSNRSQKATIRVVPRKLKWWEILLVAVGSFLGAALISYLGAAVYAYYNPRSWLFSPRYRPRVLRWFIKPQTLEEMEAKRKACKSGDTLVASGQVSVSAVAASSASGPRSSHDQNFPSPGGGLMKAWGNDWAGRTLVCMGCTEGQRVAVAIYIVLNIVVFFWGFFTVGSRLKTWGVSRSSAWATAVGAGYSLSLNLAVGILPSLKSLHTALRGSGTMLRDWIPIDDPFMLQTKVGVLTGIWTCVHVGGHFRQIGAVAQGVPLQEDPLGVWRLTLAQMQSGSPVADQLLTWTNLTGLLGLLLLVVLFAAAAPRFDYAQRVWPCLRLCGGFNLYQRAHMLWPLFYLIIIMHGTPCLYVWLFFPLACYVLDRLLLLQRQLYPAVLFSARLVGQDVLHLALEVPEGFSYHAGQYVLLCWRGEWHPFTLTSAPEERLLSVHLRSPPEYDWCAALRQRVLVDAPKAAHTSKLVGEPAPGTTVEYEPLVLPSGTVSVPRSESRPKDDPKRASARRADGPIVLQMARPEDAGDTVAIKMAGPFGPISSSVFEFSAVMLVGVGFDTTPVVSILRSVQMRAQRRAQILAATGSKGKADLFGLEDGRPSTAPGGDAKLRQMRETAAAQQGASSRLTSVVGASKASGSGASSGGGGSAWSSDLAAADLVRHAVQVPGRIHLYWLVRSTAELQWCHSMLVGAAEGPAKAILDVTIFIAPEVDTTQLDPLPCRGEQRLHVGRPRWGAVFEAVKAEHPGCDVGVFLCGSNDVGAKLLKQARKRSDPPQAGSTGTSFCYFREHF
jgi:hypothetical protein